MSGFYNRQQKGSPLAIYDEGILLTANATSVDFTGSGVNGTVIGNAVTEVISGAPGTAVNGETPTGAVDNSNTTFTLAHTPNSGTLHLYLNGSRLKITDDYTLVGNTITFILAPQTGSILLADYSY